MAIIVIASHWVGLTLPGMIEEPGSFSGRISSPKPARGPQAARRMSSAIFISETASARRAPDSRTSASCAPCAAKRFGAGTNGRPVRRAISAIAASAKPGGALTPVPTAVPPSATA